VDHFILTRLAVAGVMRRTSALSVVLLMTLCLHLGAWAQPLNVGSTAIGEKEYYADFSGSRNLFEVAPDNRGKPRPLLSPDHAKEYLWGQFIVDPAHGRFLLTPPGKSVGKQRIGNRLVLVDPNSSEPRVILDKGTRVMWPMFSPDGNRIAYFSAPPDIDSFQMTDHEGYALHVLDVSSGADVAIGPNDKYPVTNFPPAWSPSGKEIAFVACFELPKHKIHIVSLESRKIRTLASAQDYAPENIIWPDLQRILFLQEGKPGLFSIDTKSETIAKVAGGHYCAPLLLSPDGKVLRVREVTKPVQPMSEVFLNVSNFAPVSDSEAQKLVHKKSWKYPALK
jgi:hypothetical protein